VIHQQCEEERFARMTLSLAAGVGQGGGGALEICASFN